MYIRTYVHIKTLRTAETSHQLYYVSIICFWTPTKHHYENIISTHVRIFIRRTAAAPNELLLLTQYKQ